MIQADFRLLAFLGIRLRLHPKTSDFLRLRLRSPAKAHCTLAPLYPASDAHNCVALFAQVIFTGMHKENLLL